MSYETKRALVTYYDTLMHFNILDKNVIKIGKSGNVLLLEVNDKKQYYMRTIKK